MNIIEWIFKMSFNLSVSTFLTFFYHTLTAIPFSTTVCPVDSDVLYNIYSILHCCLTYNIN